MNRIKKFFWLYNAGVLLLLAPSCTNIKNNQKSGGDSQEINQNTDESVLYLLPSPGEILLRFYSTDIQYKPELLNSPEYKDKYIGSKSQALNLGVYITDMAYSALFERSVETINYLEAIQSLSSESGISSGVFENLLARSKANAGQLDSLANISNEAFTNMLEFLENGGKETTIAQISAGAYIESLYVALQSIEDYSKDNETLTLLVEMKYPMDNLMQKAKNSISEGDTTIVNYLNEISAIFNELDTSGEETLITQEPDGVLSIAGGDDIRIDEKGFAALKNKVIEIRSGIVYF